MTENAKEIYLKLRKVVNNANDNYEQDDVMVVAEHLDNVGIKAEDI